MDLNIRFATAGDAKTIHDFICELAAYEREPDAVQVSVATLRKQLAADKPPFECLLAETFDAQPLGFALYFVSYSTWRGTPGIYLEDLYVPEPLRGRGIGSALFNRLAKIAVSRGYARLEWAVLNWNQPAIDFYQAMGATSLNTWTTWRLTDEPLQRLAK